MQKNENTETYKCRNMKIQRHKNAEIKVWKYKNTENPNYESERPGVVYDQDQ